MQKYGGFHLREYLRSGSKAIDVKEKQRERERNKEQTLVILTASYTLPVRLKTTTQFHFAPKLVWARGGGAFYILKLP